MTTLIPLPFGPDAYTPDAYGTATHSVKVLQGFGGSFSHSVTENDGIFFSSVDFALGLGTPVLSQGEGKVIAMVENLPDGGPEALSRDSSWGTNGIGNYITVEYYGGSATARGFYATYQHLQHDGVEVKVGDTITTSQLLGYVGNTGYRDGTHLHVGFGKYLYTDWKPDEIADGRSAENNNTEPVLFATLEDSDGKLDPGEYYHGDNGNTLYGSAGDDILNGEAGNDTLYPGGTLNLVGIDLDSELGPEMSQLYSWLQWHITSDWFTLGG